MSKVLENTVGNSEEEHLPEYGSGHIPDLNIKKDSIVDIYKNNKHLKALRNRNNLKGKCLNCKFSRICGGCRAKIYAQTGDFFAEDAACILFESV